MITTDIFQTRKLMRKKFGLCGRALENMYNISIYILHYISIHLSETYQKVSFLFDLIQL